MKFNRNNQIMLLLYFIVVVFLLLQLYELYDYKNEHFQDNRIKNSNIQSLIISPFNDDDTTNNKYFGTYIVNKNNKNINNALYFYETVSLKSNSWIKSRYKNMLLENGKKIIITDITFDKSKKMIAIGIEYTNNKHKYNIYKKKTSDINSEWVKLADDIKIKSLCYDNKTTKLLGVSSFDGQIYSNDDHKYLDWVGPINYDIPMRKIMFNKEDNMIGIGLFDNFIYIKSGANWRIEAWDKTKINKTKVHDLLYDYDGCLLGTTTKGIIKQINPDLSSDFINIKNHNKKFNNMLTIFEILKAKIGIELDDDIFDTDTDFGAYLKKMYNIKKLTIDLCASKKYLKDKKYNKNVDEMDELSFKHREIGDLYKKIEEINEKMMK